MQNYTFEDLLKIMAKLRSQDGCPWDRIQTHATLRQFLLEESYETIEAIDKNDDIGLIEELGDVLLQVVFHAQIASEESRFTIQDVINGICNKLIRRHSHIFNDGVVDTAEQVVNRWDKIKAEEKGLKTYSQRFKDIPKALPALMKSYKVQEKAARIGFDWNDIRDVMAKVDEEVQELKNVYLGSDYGKIVEEIGDLLFAVVNLSRFLGIQPELALSDAIDKFINRFQYMESSAESAGKCLENMTLDEMNELWEQAKL